MEVPMQTPGTPEAVVAAPGEVVAEARRAPTLLLLGLMTLAMAALWLVAFDNGQASAMVDSTGTALHEMFHDGRHLLGAPCH
jgi:putative cobalt transporter subunit CbtB